jgi:cytochrome P450
MRGMIFEIAVAFIVGDDGVDKARLAALFGALVAGLFTPIPVDLPFTAFGKAVRARRALDDELGRVIDRRRGERGAPRDILGSLLLARDEEGRPLSREAILDELTGELFAGHDTTINASANLMLLLAEHPAVMDRARAELAHMPPAAPLDLEAQKAIPHLQHVILEGMRLVPPVGSGYRVALDDLAYGGYRIPRGWTVGFTIRGEHRSGAWPRPDAFDPDRFSRGEHKHEGCAFIPFSGGPRACVGQHFAMVEMTILLARLLRGYTWELVPGQDLRYTLVPFPRPKSGLVVRFRRREPGSR